MSSSDRRNSVASTNSSNSSGSSHSEEVLSRRRKELFGDCALIEIIHLHDCLRGALKALENDVTALAAGCSIQTTTAAVVSDLERRVAGRFKVIWSVFKSHSHAEDEFIWPALKTKTRGRIQANNNHNNNHHHHHHHHPAPAAAAAVVQQQAPPLAHHHPEAVVIEQEEYEEDHADEERMFSQMDKLLSDLHEALVQQQRVAFGTSTSPLSKTNSNNNKKNIEQMAHSILENTRMLSQHLMAHLEKEETQCMPLVVKHLSKQEIHELVGQIMGQRSADTIAQIMTMAVQNLEPQDRDEMVKYMKQSMAGTFFDRWLLMSGWMSENNNNHNNSNSNSNSNTATTTAAITATASQGSMAASNEPPDCKPAARQQEDSMPHDNVPSQLSLFNAGSNNTNNNENHIAQIVTTRDGMKKSSQLMIEDAKKRAASLLQENNYQNDVKKAKTFTNHATNESDMTGNNDGGGGGLSITSQAELEKLIRAIASNPALTPAQKNTTIQGLRDSVWKSNKKYKEQQQQRQQQLLYMGGPPMINVCHSERPAVVCSPTTNNKNNNNNNKEPNNHNNAAATTTSTTTASSLTTGCCKTRRVTPPSVYFRKNNEGRIESVWSSDEPSSTTAAVVDTYGHNVPLFSAAELAPTYHDGAAGTVLGCPHYARACKLRHPKSGRLYTCRLCCDQQRELPMKDQDEVLDRYSVTEVMCMKCNALQPAEDRCINPDCESRGKPFAKYFCKICHLYDDGSRPIFHCPYCNTCRLGLGLGIDFRHCMRCNACVSLSDKDHHCIPQKLQGSCPICHESLFQSTDPLRGLKCGHVMHLSCFTEYRRGHAYTCPLCMRSMEDMKDYFALLDTAVRMQPMPAAYLSTMSNIYCQDCGGTGRVPYHFVGQKCPNCASYNTRELGRVHNSPAASPRSGEGH